LLSNKPSKAASSSSDATAKYIKLWGQPAQQRSWLSSTSGRQYRVYDWTMPDQSIRVLMMGGAASGQPSSPDFRAAFAMSPDRTQTESVEVSGGDSTSQSDESKLHATYLPTESKG